MKRLISLAFFAFFLFGGVIFAQQKCEAPVLKIGDRWVYKDARGKQFQLAVVEVSDEGFSVKGRERTDIYDKITLNWKFVVDAGGKKTKPEVFFRKPFDFPLFIGKKWGERLKYPGGRGGRVTQFNVYKVEALEDVKTPAGTFKAYRIVAKAEAIIHPGSEKREGVFKIWYAPEVKFWIKREYESGVSIPLWKNVSNAVLFEYRLKSD